MPTQTFDRWAFGEHSSYRIRCTLRWKALVSGEHFFRCGSQSKSQNLLETVILEFMGLFMKNHLATKALEDSVLSTAKSRGGSIVVW